MSMTDAEYDSCSVPCSQPLWYAYLTNGATKSGMLSASTASAHSNNHHASDIAVKVLSPCHW